MQTASVSAGNYSHKRQQSAYERVSYNLLVLLFQLCCFYSCFSGLQLGIDIPITSKCEKLKQTVYQLNRPDAELVYI